MLRRWLVTDDDGDDAGSVFACSRDCAESAAEMNDATLGACQGTDGVDEMTVCDGCGSADGEDDDPRCDYCAQPSEDGCHACDAAWCFEHRYEHECPKEASDAAV